MNKLSCGWNVRVSDQHGVELINIREDNKGKALDWLRGLTRSYLNERDFDITEMLNTGTQVRLVHPDGHVRFLTVTRN